MSELLPQLASVIDDVCVIRSMYTFNPTHTPGRALFHTGSVLATRPSMGSWITYGLGHREREPPGVRRARQCRRRRTADTVRDFCRPSIRALDFAVADPDPEKIIPNLRNKNVDADAQRADMDALLGAEPEPREVVRRRSIPRRAHQVDGDGLSHAVRGAGAVRHPQRAAAHPRGVRHRRRSATAACSRGGWSKRACATSTWIIRAGRSGTTIAT